MKREVPLDRVTGGEIQADTLHHIIGQAHARAIIAEIDLRAVEFLRPDPIVKTGPERTPDQLTAERQIKLVYRRIDQLRFGQDAHQAHFLARNPNYPSQLNNRVAAFEESRVRA